MCMCLVLFVVSEIPESKSSEQQVERLYIILSFRPSGDLGWVSSLTDGHATMLRSAVSSGRQVVHRSRRIFVGREVSSAAAAADGHESFYTDAHPRNMYFEYEVLRSTR